MAQEIERKFIINEIPSKLLFKSNRPVHQGYLKTGKEYEVRISNHLKLTSKSGDGLSREEIETKITQEMFDILWPLTEGKRVEKTRYLYTVGDYVAELDVYEGKNKGIMTVEVEFPSEEEAHAFTPPEWFGKEVTGVLEYRNSILAK